MGKSHFISYLLGLVRFSDDLFDFLLPFWIYLRPILGTEQHGRVAKRARAQSRPVTLDHRRGQDLSYVGGELAEMETSVYYLI